MIQVQHLAKSYGSKAVLKDVSFTVPEGEVVGLLGLNGAGKSTTMNILTGYISAGEGTVTICGHDIMTHASAAKRMIGYLPEQPAFYPEMRVCEHLDFICDLKGVTKNRQKRREHVESICQRVGIFHVYRRMVHNLSKGYRQRVGFAQALIGDPRVLILDEPTVGLDPSQIVDIRQLIHDAGTSCTVIVSSHILSEIQAVCDRVMVLSEGRIVADAAPETLMRRLSSPHRMRVRILGEPERVAQVLCGVEGVQSAQPLSQPEPGAWEYAVEGQEGRDIRTALFRALAAADLPMLASYGAERSLEDAFLHLTMGGEGHRSGEGQG